jgi:hypothetical protein
MAKKYSISGRRRSKPAWSPAVGMTKSQSPWARRSTATKPISRPAAGDAYNVSRIRNHLPAALANKTVKLLAAHDLRRWRDGLAKVMAPASVNRVPAGLIARLRSVTLDRPDNAPLLVKPGGGPWKKSDQSRPFRRVALRAGLDPKVVTLYALRHSNIVRQLLANVPIRIVAVTHDTSVQMIEKTYSRHIGDHTDALTRPALLDVSVS